MATTTELQMRRELGFDLIEAAQAESGCHVCDAAADQPGDRSVGTSVRPALHDRASVAAEPLQ